VSLSWEENKVNTGDYQSPGANPATLSYNATVEKIYRATNSMVRFLIKLIFL
jgi:hypothetical protein